MKSLKSLFALAGLLLLSGCYHTQVTTGLTPSAVVIDIPFAHSFLYGLIPPKEVKAASQCENGVAKVETQISPANGIVAAITFSLYTPMHITVTCAAAERADALPSDAQKIEGAIADWDANYAKTVGKAAEMAKNLNQPIYIVF
jgi:hypothetical protein